MGYVVSRLLAAMEVTRWQVLKKHGHIVRYNQQLFLEPEWALSQWPMRRKASWAINSEAMTARGIIVLVKSN